MCIGYLPGARSSAVRWTLRLFRSSSKKGLVTGEKGQMGRVGVGIPYIPLPVHSEMMDLTYLGAQSYQKRCLQVKPPVFWGGHLLLACVKVGFL